MIQRVFYGYLGVVSEDVAPRDLNAREHLALWPFVAMFLLMGVASPLFLKTIDVNGTQIAGKAENQPREPKKIESESYGPAASTSRQDGKVSVAVNDPEGRLY
jgi:NADH-quinone oxidoreductase subunit M